MEKQSLVILAATQGATSQLQKFLIGRQWEVSVVMEVDRAIALITANKPSYIMVSTDHPAQNARVVIEGQTYGSDCPIIMFSEKVATSTGGKIKGSPGHHLNMPITGSNFLRIIEKIKTDPKLKTDMPSGTASPTPSSGHSKEESFISHKSEDFGSVTNIPGVPYRPEEVKRVVGNSVEFALKSITSGGKLTDTNTPTTGTNTVCLFVNSPQFSGYLVTALGDNRPLSQEFMGLLQSKLNEFLSATGEQIATLETLEVKLKPILLEDWAKSNALFVHKNVHEGSELAVAFVTKPDLGIEVLEGSTADMLKMSAKDLATGQVIDFELFHYLPLNKKYVKMSHKGIILGPDQHIKMKAKFAHLQVKKEDAKSVELYSAKLQLCKIINQFHLTGAPTSTKSKAS